MSSSDNSDSDQNGNNEHITSFRRSHSLAEAKYGYRPTEVTNSDGKKVNESIMSEEEKEFKEKNSKIVKSNVAWGVTILLSLLVPGAGFFYIASLLKNNMYILVAIGFIFVSIVSFALDKGGVAAMIIYFIGLAATILFACKYYKAPLKRQN